MRFYELLKVGYGVLDDALKEVMERFGRGRALIFTGDEFALKYGRRVRERVGGEMVVGDADPPEGNFAVVLGVGGGSVIDRAKAWAHAHSLPFISVPTLPSSDGIASPVCVEDGRSRFLELPYGVIADLNILVSAPRWSLLAGVGDLLSNLSASYDWDRFRGLSREPYHPEASAISKASALSMIGADPEADADVLVWGLIASGLAMNLAGSSRPASGPEHKISHALDLVGYGEKHGIQVGIFTPLFLKLNGFARWREVREYLRSLGLPDGVSLTLRQAERVFSLASGTRPHRYTVLEEVGWERALEEAISLGFVRIVG